MRKTLPSGLSLNRFWRFLVVLTAVIGIAGLGGVAHAAPQPADTTLTITKHGMTQSTVIDDNGQIDCGSDCSGTYPPTCEVEGAHGCLFWTTGITTLRTTPAPGFQVVWSGQSCQQEVIQTTNDCTVDGEGTVNAHFDDLSAPNVSLTQPSAGPKRGTISLSATASDAQTGINRVEFVVGGVSQGNDTTAPYTVPYDTALRADGPVQVIARAFNHDGDAADSAVTITIDNTAPSLSVGGPDGATFGLGSTQTWTYSGSDATTGPPTVQCSVTPTSSGQSYGPCSPGAGSHSVSNSPEGSYTFRARASDGAGNTTEVIRSFTIDGTAPNTVIDSGPADGSSSSDTSATFGFLATESGSTFRCRVYPTALTPAFGPCSDGASHTASGFSPGTYSFEVVATDAYGNVDPTSAKRTFTVTAPATGNAADTSAPTLTLSIPRQKLVAVLSRGLKVRGTCNEACRANAQLVLAGPLAKRLRLSKKSKPVVIGTTSASSSASGALQITVKLTTKAKRILRRLRSVRIQVVATATDGANNKSGPVTTNVTLRR